ncbi:type II toxin-antitoxin system YoeB family toxin [Brachyspira hampsonii]|nr:type II toxin-antitoxin system YoeB family toxin [Brachyspira hampsonii]
MEKVIEELEELEKLKYDKKDLYSKRINLEYRLVYHIENNNILQISL